MNLKLGENIRKLRQQNNVTQEQLADILHVTPQAVSRWENETAYPNVYHFVTLANYFSVSIDELVGQDNLCVTNDQNDNTVCGTEGKCETSDLLDEVIRITMSVLCTLIDENNRRISAGDSAAMSIELRTNETTDEQVRKIAEYFNKIQQIS